MTQSIQTKQVSVTITDWSDLNLYDLIENPIEGNYAFELAGVTYSEEILGNDLYQSSILLSQYSMEEAMLMGIDIRCASILFNADEQVVKFGQGASAVLNSYFNSVTFSPGAGQIYELTAPLSLTFWVTGMFEDEGVGLQGDMNDDEILNVVDIVALVNIILDEEE